MSIRFDLLGLVVKSIPESVDFYRLLGLDIPQPPEGEDHFEYVLPNGLRLAWDNVELMKSFLPHWVEPVGHRMGMAFLCESPTAVDATFERMVGAGHLAVSPPWDAFWGQRYAQVGDPDGNVVDLFAPL